ncbi:hypothetical protein COF68_06220 [Bacillus toyonensis]|uniref:hypothetical protein n=1 Tax=Bacillus toyonensis TaxID=155322 RepID=UPI000BFD22A7|nr:hypothetical protein [Bacillus toyonensis]PHE64429.1 hypothetical protein COF68_06220 [Bacillus toyonensis]
MKKHVNTYYMSVHEDIKDSNGEKADFDRLMSSTGHVERYVCMNYSVNTIEDLLEQVEAKLKNYISNLNEYTRTETEYGWVYEMYVRWFNDDMEYEVVEKGKHTHHEVYVVDVTFILEETNVIEKMRRGE